jgi:hypothetical protein
MGRMLTKAGGSVNGVAQAVESAELDSLYREAAYVKIVQRRNALLPETRTVQDGWTHIGKVARPGARVL